jgi:rhamnogalacturonyl hydrolase YesR
MLKPETILMIRMKCWIGIICMCFFVNVQAQKIKLNKVIADAERQTRVMLEEIAIAQRTGNTPFVVSPRSIDKGKLKIVPAKDWTSGFFPGQLWFLYEFTGKQEWKKLAEDFTKKIESQQYDRTTHDLGFKIYCSAGTGYRLTKNKEYKDVIIQAATTLSKRFNLNAGAIKSWDHMLKWKYPVIIDNMMNLELLFEAGRLSGDSSFYKIAVAHANTTLKNHFRSDNSSYHVVDYDTSKQGAVLSKNTHQGFADESAWARGQAWGLYGYTMCYRETKDIRYLKQAEKIADYILNHPRLPQDLVPYWDFDAPGIPSEPRDASAAAVIASGLYELSLYSSKREYKKDADKILNSLVKNYRSPIGENKGFLLIHSTGNKPEKNEIDAPLSYADYYYMEALQRRNKLNTGSPLF